MKPKVSIIIPVYNGEKYMREAIDSALNQTYDNCEIIVINDGSTDATEEIAKSYGDEICYFAKENGGVSTAMNLGIQNMTGDYFAWLSHDDVYYPHKIARQVETIQQSGDEMTVVWSAYTERYEETGNRKRSALPYKHSIEFLQKSVSPLIFSALNVGTVMIHRKHFENVGLFDETLFTSQDYDMCFRVFRNRINIYIDEPLVEYRYHAEQGTQIEPNYMQNCIDISRKMVNSLTREEIEDLFGDDYRLLYYLQAHYWDMWNSLKNKLWYDIWQETLEKFNTIDEPEYVKEELSKAKQYLDELSNGIQLKLVLHCAGRNAEKLVRSLHERNIVIDAITDSDRNKHGMNLEGIVCRGLCEDDKEYSLIIVTKDNPADLMEILRSDGYKHVTSYEKIGYKLFEILPLKSMVGKSPDCEE